MSSSTKQVSVPKSVLIGAGALLLVLLIAVGVGIGVLLAPTKAPAAAPEVSTAATPSPSKSPAVKPTSKPNVKPVAPAPPASPPAPTTYRVGETFTTGNVTLTVHAVEVMDSIATVYGSDLVPDAGGQLVLIKTTYSNSKTQADLSCGNTDLYVQVFDAQQREMAPVFETASIPGNPGCNDHLLQDTPHEWNFAFQSVAGATPAAISLTETDKWLDPVWVDLQ